MPLAKLLSVPCKAKATTNATPPITASNGLMLTSSAETATINPTNRITRRTVRPTKVCNRTDIRFEPWIARSTPLPTSTESNQKTRTVTANSTRLRAQRNPPSSDPSQPVSVIHVALVSETSIVTSATAST